MGDSLIFYDVDFAPANAAIARLVAATGLEASVVVKQQSRLLLEDAIDLTPPNGGGVTGLAARKRGEAAIEHNLTGTYGLFSGVRIKGRRKITTVFGRKIKKAIFVPTRLQPYGTDPDPIYERRKDKYWTATGWQSRGQRAAYYVDKAKLAALRGKLKKRVGKLASGWIAGLRALGGQAASWIQDQVTAGTRGSFTPRLDPSLDDPSFEAWCTVKGHVVYIMTKRLQAAVNIRAAKIERSLPHILDRAIKTARL